MAEALIPASKDPLFEGHFCVGSVGGDGGPWHVFSSYKHIGQVDVYVNIDIYTHIESPISSFAHLNIDVGCLVKDWCFSVTIIKREKQNQWRNSYMVCVR